MILTVFDGVGLAFSLLPFNFKMLIWEYFVHLRGICGREKSDFFQSEWSGGLSEVSCCLAISINTSLGIPASSAIP